MIADVPILLLGTIFLEETYAPVHLLRKKQQLLKETGNIELFTRYEQQGCTLMKDMKDTLMRSMKLMGTQTIIAIMGLYQAYLYRLMYKRFRVLFITCFFAY